MAAIHPGFVNLEAWQVDPDSLLPTDPSQEPALADADVTGHVELELTPAEARRLAEALLDGAHVAELPAFELDGGRIRTLEDFFDEVSRVLIPQAEWGRNLDAFNDILRGGFGTPEGGFLLVWKDHFSSREGLSYAETARVLQRRLEQCDPSNRDSVARDLAHANGCTGPTAFDWLVDMIADHGPGGAQEADRVRLELR